MRRGDTVLTRDDRRRYRRRETTMTTNKIEKIREMNAIANAAWKRYDDALAMNDRNATMVSLAEARAATDAAEALLDTTGMDEFNKSFGMM